MCHLADHEESLVDQWWSTDHTLTNTDLEPSGECVIEQDVSNRSRCCLQGYGTFLIFLQLQEQLSELELERDLLKESNAKLLSRSGAARKFLNVCRRGVNPCHHHNFQCLRRVSGAQVADPGAAAEGADSPAGDGSEG